jgi:REP element-mobilizing transposase RayT
MARALRRDLPDGFVHVTARGVAGEHVYLDDDDRRAFLAILGAALARTRLETHALCLMGTHYHLVVEGLVRELSRLLHRVNGTYAQVFNVRHGRFGHLFADRFSATPIESEEHLVEACRYVLLNPCRAGLVEAPDDWPWSKSRYGFDVA